MRQTKLSILYFVGPAMLLFGLIFLYPTVRTALMSFYTMKNVTSPISEWTFAGLSNYIKLFHTPMMYTYQMLFGSEVSADSVNTGVAAASACIMTLVVVIVSSISRKFVKDETYEL